MIVVPQHLCEVQYERPFLRHGQDTRATAAVCFNTHLWAFFLRTERSWSIRHSDYSIGGQFVAGDLPAFLRHARLGAVVFVLLGISSAFPQSSLPAFETTKDRIRSATETVVLARVDSTTVTNQVLRSWLRVAKPSKLDRLTIDQIMGLPGPDLASVIRNLGFYNMSNQEALRDKDFVSTGLPIALTSQRDQILQSALLEKEINEKNPPMSEQDARRWYEENANQYTMPFTFSAYAIFLSTYRPYSAFFTKSNTLATLGEIAADVIGQPKAIHRILDSRTSSPLFPPSDPKAIDYFFGAPIRPPASLEILQLLPPLKQQGRSIVWIPMDDQGRQAVRQRMEKIEAELRAGADFTALAKRHSDEPAELRGQLIGPLPTPGRPLLDGVLEAAVKTPAGSITPILETPHGFLLLKIVQKEERTVRPFEEVRAELIAEEMQRRRAKAASELARSLFSDPALKIDRAGIMAKDAPDSRVIARVGDFAYTWGDYRRDTRRRYSAPPTYEGRVELLSSSVLLRDKLAAARAVTIGLDREPAVAIQLAAVEMIFRGRAYVEWYAAHRVRITEEDLQKFYHDERERFRESGKYEVRELIIKLDPDENRDDKKVANTMDFLANDVARRIKSERLFAIEARAQSNWPIQERQRGELKTVEENYRGTQFAEVLAGLEPGRCAGPFHIGNDIFLVWLRERSKRRYREYEEVKAHAKELYRQLHWDELLGIAEKEIRSRHEMILLFTYPERGETDSAPQAASNRSL